LHFVDDEYNAVLITDSPKLGQEVCRRNDISALTLDRLDYDCGAVFRRDCGLKIVCSM